MRRTTAVIGLRVAFLLVVLVGWEALGRQSGGAFFPPPGEWGSDDPDLIARDRRWGLVWGSAPHRVRYSVAYDPEVFRLCLNEMVAEAGVRLLFHAWACEPILEGAWLKRGAHVNAIGAPMPTWRELDDEAMANTVVVESREAAMKESGDIILSKARIRAEAGEIFAGKKTIPVSGTTVFKSVGVAIEDVTAAKLAFDESMRRREAGA